MWWVLTEMSSLFELSSRENGKLLRQVQAKTCLARDSKYDAAVVLLGSARGKCLCHLGDNRGIVGKGSSCKMLGKKQLARVK